ncbi:hypothetical protein MMC31_004682 [Peltigera leucophlebia]|nr:hypothetical protein [Peltigera leucophlebia]
MAGMALSSVLRLLILSTLAFDWYGAGAMVSIGEAYVDALVFVDNNSILHSFLNSCVVDTSAVFDLVFISHVNKSIPHSFLNSCIVDPSAVFDLVFISPVGWINKSILHSFLNSCVVDSSAVFDLVFISPVGWVNKSILHSCVVDPSAVFISPVGWVNKSILHSFLNSFVVDSSADFI